LKLADSTGLTITTDFLKVSDAASVVQGMSAYGQHQAFVNDRWMAAYAMLLEKATSFPRSPETALD
jgi:hypothetical protein